MEYKLEKSFRKSISMQYKNKELIVKAPFFVTKKIVDDFVEKNSLWIEKRQKMANESLLDLNKISEYKKNSKNYIIPRTYELAKKFGFEFNKIRITSAKTRWGSCTSKRNLNFSYRLILTPKDKIDYVIIHELAHLKHMNHSKKFWTEVESMMPDYKEKEKWLKQNSYLFH